MSTQRQPHDSMAIAEGDRLRLNDGSVVSVDFNPRDGVWLFCTYESSPDDSLVGQSQQPVYGTEVAAFVEGEEI